MRSRIFRSRAGALPDERAVTQDDVDLDPHDDLQAGRTLQSGSLNFTAWRSSDAHARWTGRRRLGAGAFLVSLAALVWRDYSLVLDPSFHAAARGG